MYSTKNNPSELLSEFMNEPNNFKIIGKHNKGEIIMFSDGNMSFLNEGTNVYAKEDVKYDCSLNCEVIFGELGISIHKPILQINTTKKYELDVKGLVELYSKFDLNELLTVEHQLFDFTFAQFDFPSYVSNNDNLYPMEIELKNELLSAIDDNINEHSDSNATSLIKIFRKLTIYK